MRPPFQRIEWLRASVNRSRYQAVIDPTVIGLSLGLIDVHSTNDDWSTPFPHTSLRGLRLDCDMQDGHGRRGFLWAAACT
jgi:hypothetical protein